MSTGLLVGIIILLLVVGVPLLQALIRWVQRQRSLGADGSRRAALSWTALGRAAGWIVGPGTACGDL